MPPKRTSTSEAPAMSQAAIKKIVVDSVATALETQPKTMANVNNANRNPEPREAHVARKCSYKEFMSCQPFNFKGSEGAIGLIRWFECTESVLSCRNCTEDCKTPSISSGNAPSMSLGNAPNMSSGNAPSMSSGNAPSNAPSISSGNAPGMSSGNAPSMSSGNDAQVVITLEDLISHSFQQVVSELAKIPVLDIGKFEQWQFQIQKHLQHEHYTLWEVIEFGDSYVVPANTKDTTAGDKSGRTLTLTAKDMQRKKNDASILKTFGGNEATKKTKKNLLKQQYGNFKAEGSETLEQTFNRLQVIIGQLQFMDVEIEQDDLNQKFLTNLAPEWLMHTIVWRNRSDLDTMSVDDLYNHLKIYESEVQKKPKQNSQNMAFISSAKHNSINEDGNTASVPTASTNVPTASTSVATISQDTACDYIASQSSGSQIKFEDINQIDEDDMEEMDIKCNMAPLSIRADKF
uniref:Ribonuclease H-like domain-containing protein n=1 Tax=Tanacetum cinerariifolium TaxID=118510 RepID=A0A699GT97_TANCI|nr:ribonuclease H-like domain-containing protein [Tanacetum cinerariifolium]